MKPATNHLDTWTTDELLKEVLHRSAGDRPALDRIQRTTMRAVLSDCDQKADANTSPATIGQPNESL
jgi:hypothetical protein